MAVTLQIEESPPESYPEIEGLTASAADWQRLETWIAYRWGVRDVNFAVEGAGEWIAPLTPFTATTTDVWQNDQWQAVIPRNGARGIILDTEEIYRIVGTVGSEEDPPAAIVEALRRLAKYSASIPLQGSAARIKSGNLSLTMQPDWTARAMQYSGAADLLRPYRRLGLC